MKNIRCRLFLVLIAFAGLLTLSARAELGLQQIMANQGAPAVGQAVLTAAKAVYAGASDPAVIQSQLIAILNEAAATGNEQAIRYAIVAVMMAGGVENITLSTTAINNSNVFSNYESLTAVTVAATRLLLSASGGGATGGGETGGGGGETGGGGHSLGGGNNNLFLLGLGVDPNNPFTWGSLTGAGDSDLPATRI
jgi:hypothetical protein